MKNLKSIFGWFVVICAVVYAYYHFEMAQISPAQPGASSTSAGAPVAPGVPVTAAVSRRGEFGVYLTSIGTVQPYTSVTIRSRVDGEITNINFKEGQFVNKGDLIAEIDSRQLLSALSSAEAKKAQDEVNLENAKLDLQRLEKLGEFASAKQIDTQRALVDQITSQVQGDKSAIENAKTQLSYAKILAPISGRIGLRMIDQGNLVTAAAQNPIATIDQIEPVSILFSEAETYVNDINAAASVSPPKVIAFTSNGKTRLSEGQLDFIDNMIDSTTGTIRMKATFANSDHQLWPGMSVLTKLLIKTLSDVIIIPENAVQHAPSGLFVYVIDDKGLAQKQDVEIAETDGQNTVVTKGLKENQLIVVSGQYKLQPGTRVEYEKPQ